MLKIAKTLSFAQVPEKAHETDAGYDLYATDYKDIPANLGRALIGTGVAISVPEGYVADIRPRSGLAAKHGLTVLNAPGTIDQGYTGEIMVNMVNMSHTDYTVKPGDRIAQLVLVAVYSGPAVVVRQLEPTERGDRGHGSTGT